MAENNKDLPAMNVNVNLDTTPIVYTDNIMMTVNEDGVVLDVCQRLGSTDQVRIVARIGMSHNHAQKLVKQLGDLLLIKGGELRSTKTVN